VGTTLCVYGQAYTGEAELARQLDRLLG
jgi:hypothetical protein